MTDKNEPIIEVGQLFFEGGFPIFINRLFGVGHGGTKHLIWPAQC
jgi:hypothetical protein